MLKETCIAEMDRLDGVKIVVTRWYPRGVRRGRFDEWLPVLGPSRELLKAVKAGAIGWSEYAQRYRREIFSNPDALKEIQRLRRLAQLRDVYLVCWEPKPPCHRFLLLDIVKELELREG